MKKIYLQLFEFIISFAMNLSLFNFLDYCWASFGLPANHLVSSVLLAELYTSISLIRKWTQNHDS